MADEHVAHSLHNFEGCAPIIESQPVASVYSLPQQAVGGSGSTALVTGLYRQYSSSTELN